MTEEVWLILVVILKTNKKSSIEESEVHNVLYKCCLLLFLLVHVYVICVICFGFKLSKRDSAGVETSGHLNLL